MREQSSTLLCSMYDYNSVDFRNRDYGRIVIMITVTTSVVMDDLLTGINC